MLKNKISKKILSTILMLMYTFVVLFSSKFHHHTHGFFDQDAFENGEKYYSVYKDNTSVKDCIACHFINQNHSLHPLEFDFKVFVQKEDEKNLQGYLLQNYSLEVDFFRLRGPPSFV